jgi:hypothetical protein
MEKGWEIRYRGGNSMCTTPSDLDVIIADMPGSPGGESSTPWLGPPTRYSIATRDSGVGVYGGQGPIFDLYDAERGVIVGLRWVPTPEQAAELLRRYGVPESEVRDIPEPVIVPETVEWPPQSIARIACIPNDTPICRYFLRSVFIITTMRGDDYIARIPQIATTGPTSEIGILAGFLGLQRVRGRCGRYFGQHNDGLRSLSNILLPE